MSNAFVRLPLEEESKKFTTKNTSEGLFTYNYLPYGLRASPGIFQSFINKAFSGIDITIVYQDDLLILTHTRDTRPNSGQSTFYLATNWN